MTNNNTINLSISAATLQDILTDNNRYANVLLSAKQVGAEDAKAWSNLVHNLHMAAYGVYVTCENSGLTVNSTSVDKTAVYNAIRAILAVVGEVKGHKLCANEELATLIIGYSGKRGNADSPALQYCLSKLGNRKRELAKAKDINGLEPKYIKSLEDQIAQLEEEKRALLSEADNRIKKPTRTTSNAFRLDVEHRLARVIAEQQAKTWEELEAEAEAKRKERRAKTAAKKAENKNK